MALSRPFKEDRLALPLSTPRSLLQATDGVISLALCLQVVSQAPQHFRSSEKQATCEGCFARQSICLVISLRSGMSSVTLLHIRQQNNCSLSDKISVKHHNSLVVLIFFFSPSYYKYSTNFIENQKDHQSLICS